ncbi:hypothetical protein GS416_09850 [Rhodococcus hoagii]|nr:hypothetical protein [Prescottella equi]
MSDREFQNKRAQSRRRNDKLLATWQGASGTTPLVYGGSRRVASSPTSSRGWAVLTPDNRATFLEQLRPGAGRRLDHLVGPRSPSISNPR